MNIDEHPTVKRMREQNHNLDVKETPVLDARWLRQLVLDAGADDVIVHGPGGNRVIARTPNQHKLVDAVSEHDMVFAVGPAGTGKTYTAVAIAVKSLKDRQVKE